MGLNHRRADFQSAALPTELSHQIKKKAPTFVGASLLIKIFFSTLDFRYSYWSPICPLASIRKITNDESLTVHIRCTNGYIDKSFHWTCFVFWMRCKYIHFVRITIHKTHKKLKGWLDAKNNFLKEIKIYFAHVFVYIRWILNEIRKEYLVDIFL